jgi:hypothetical protein
MLANVLFSHSKETEQWLQMKCVSPYTFCPDLAVPYTFCLFLILFILKKIQTFHAKFLFPGDGSLLLAYPNLLGTKGYDVVVG